ncbi:hypothetical protein RI367_008795 [Sorochytrium milnesiophthora]
MKCTRATAIALLTSCMLMPSLGLPGPYSSVPAPAAGYSANDAGYPSRPSDSYQHTPPPPKQAVSPTTTPATPAPVCPQPVCPAPVCPQPTCPEAKLTCPQLKLECPQPICPPSSCPQAKLECPKPECPTLPAIHTPSSNLTTLPALPPIKTCTESTGTTTTTTKFDTMKAVNYGDSDDTKCTGTDCFNVVSNGCKSQQAVTVDNGAAAIRAVSGGSTQSGSSVIMQSPELVKFGTVTADLQVNAGATGTRYFEFKAQSKQQQQQQTMVANQVSLNRAAIEWTCDTVASSACQARWVASFNTGGSESGVLERSGVFSASAIATADFSQCTITYNEHGIQFKIGETVEVCHAASLANNVETRIAECEGHVQVGVRRTHTDMLVAKASAHAGISIASGAGATTTPENTFNITEVTLANETMTMVRGNIEAMLLIKSISIQQ